MAQNISGGNSRNARRHRKVKHPVNVQRTYPTFSTASDFPSHGVYARYVGRVGALALALGVGAAVATGHGMGLGVAWAQDDGAPNDNASSVDTANPQTSPTDGPGAQTPTTGSDDPDPDPASVDPGDTGMQFGSSGGQNNSVNDGGQVTDTDPDEGEDADEDTTATTPESETGPTASPVTPTPESPPAPVDPPITQNQSGTQGVAAQGNSVTTTPTGAQQQASGQKPSGVGPQDLAESTAMTTSAVVPMQSRFGLAPESPSGDHQLFTTTGDASAFSTLAQPAPAPNPAGALTGALVNLATSIVSALLSPFLATGGPTAPAEPPLFWAVLAFVRREVQRSFFNKTPDAVNNTATTDEDTALNINVLGNDIDDDTLRVTAVTQPTGPNAGTVSINPDGTIKYTPHPSAQALNTGQQRVETFTYTVSDESGGFHMHGSGGRHTDTATVTVTVTGKNDGPDAVNDTATSTEDGFVNINVLTNDTAQNPGATLTVQSFTQPTNGGTVVKNADGTLKYTPGVTAQVLSPGQNQVNTFNYTVSDGGGSTDTATVTVTVTGIDDAPTVSTSGGATTFTENGAAVIVDTNLTVTDPDSNLSGAIVTITNPQTGDALHFVPPANSNITVDPTSTGTTLKLTGAASAAAYQTALRAITFSSAGENPSTVNRAISFAVTDDEDPSNTATKSVAINVVAVNDAPVGQASPSEPDPITGTVTISVTASDPDGDAVTIAPPTVTGGTLTPTGTVTENGTTTATYTYTPDETMRDAAAATPNADTVALSFTITDSSGTSSAASAVVTVAPTPDDGLVGDPIPLAGAPAWMLTNPQGTHLFQFSEVTDPETGARSTVIQMIDTSTGTQTGPPITRPGSVYYGDLQFSEDGKRAYLTTRSYEDNVSTFTVLDSATGAVIGTPVTVDGYGYSRFNDDKSRFYLHGQSSEEATTDFVIVDTTTGAIIGSKLTIAGNAYPQFSEDGARAIFTGYSESDGYRTVTVTIVDMEAGSIIGEATSLTADYYVDVRIIDEGKRVLLIGIRDGYWTYGAESLRIIDAETGALLAADATVDRTFRRVDFNADYSRAFLTTDPGDDYTDYTFTVIDTGTGAVGDVVSVEGGYRDPVFSADRSVVVLASYAYENNTATSKLIVVDAQTGRVVGQPLTVNGDASAQVTFNEDGSRAVLVSSRYEDNRSFRSLTTLNTETAEFVGERVDVDGSYGQQVVIAGGHAYLVNSTSSYSNNMYHYTTRMAVVDLETGTQVGEQVLLDGQFDKLRFVDDRAYLTAVRRHDQYGSIATTTIAIIDTESGAILGQPRAVKQYLPEQLEFSEDGTRLFLNGQQYSSYGSRTGELQIVDTRTGALVGDAFLAGRNFAGIYRIEDGTIYLVEATNSSSPSATFTILNSMDGTITGQPVQLAGSYRRTQLDYYGGSRAYLLTTSYDQTLNRTVTHVAVIDTSTGTLVNTPLTLDGTEDYYYSSFQFTEDGSRAVYVINGYEYDPVLNTTVSVQKAGLIDGEQGTLVGSPVAVIGGDDHYVFFNDDQSRAHVRSTVDGWVTTEWGGYSTTELVGLTTIDTGTGALVGPGIELDHITWNEFDVNDEGTRAYVTLRDEAADTVTFTVYNLDTGVAGTPITLDAENGELEATKWLADRSRVILVAVVNDPETGWETTTVLVDTATGTAVGAPVVLDGQPQYNTPQLSADESQAFISTYEYTGSSVLGSYTRYAIIDTETGAVVNPAPEDAINVGIITSPNGQKVTIFTRVDDLENPDPSTLETVFVVGESGEPIVMRGYTNGSVYYSADGNTMHVFTVDREYYLGTGDYDPTTIRTHYVAIDLIAGTALGDGPTEVGGIPVYNSYDGGGGPGGDEFGNFVMRTKQYAADGSVTTRLIFLDRQTNELVTTDISGEPQGNYSLRKRYYDTTAIQATRADDENGPATRLTLVNLETGEVIGTPIVLPGTERAWNYYNNSEYVEFTETAADGGISTTMTRIDWSTGTVVGDPVTLEGTVYRYYETNAERTQLYITTRVSNADGSYSYLFHIVPIDEASDGAGSSNLVA